MRGKVDEYCIELARSSICVDIRHDTSGWVACITMDNVVTEASGHCTRVRR